MPGLTDPTPAMQSFQELLHRGARLERGRIDPTVGFYVDAAGQNPRFVYVKMAGPAVTAYACFVPYARQDGSPVFAVGYAVPAEYRDRGMAKTIFDAGIAELRNGFAGHPPFFVEAIVDPGNAPSLRVAAAVLRIEPNAITDQVSGRPAIQFIRKFDTGR